MDNSAHMKQIRRNAETNARKLLNLLSERAGEYHEGLVKPEMIAYCRRVIRQSGEPVERITPMDDYKIGCALNDLEHRLHLGY